MSNKKNKMPKTAAARFSTVKITNDLMMNRLMIAFVAAVTAVTIVMCVRNVNTTINMYEKVGPVLTVVLAVLFAASLGFFIYRKVKKTADGAQIATKYNILGCGVLALACAAMYAVNPAAASVGSVIAILAATVLYFIWYIYPTAFFMLSLFLFTEAFVIYAGFGFAAVRTSRVILQTALRIAALLLPVLFSAAVLFFNKKVRSSVPVPVLLLCAAAALIGAVLLMLSSVFYIPYLYVLMVLCGIYLGIGVYCTVHMI